MARPRTPTNVLEMRGAYKVNPGRKRDREREPRDLAPLEGPPAGLNDAEKACWVEIVGKCPWLTAPDGLLLERTARLLTYIRSLPGFNWQAEKSFQACIRLLGIPATERSKVIAPTKKPSNKYADLA